MRAGFVVLSMQEALIDPPRDVRIAEPVDSAQYLVRYCDFCSGVSCLDIQFSCISSREHEMQVAKWGNSLAVRLPAAVVEGLDLKAGDEIEIVVDDPRQFSVRKKAAVDELMRAVRGLRGAMPVDFIFDREEANSRGR